MPDRCIDCAAPAGVEVLRPQSAPWGWLLPSSPLVSLFRARTTLEPEPVALDAEGRCGYCADVARYLAAEALRIEREEAAAAERERQALKLRERQAERAQEQHRRHVARVEALRLARLDARHAAPIREGLFAAIGDE